MVGTNIYDQEEIWAQFPGIPWKIEKELLKFTLEAFTTSTLFSWTGTKAFPYSSYKKYLFVQWVKCCAALCMQLGVMHHPNVHYFASKMCLLFRPKQLGVVHGYYVD